MEHRGHANTGVIIVSTEKLKKINNSDQSFVPHRIISVVKTAEFVSDFLCQFVIQRQSWPPQSWG